MGNGQGLPIHNTGSSSLPNGFDNLRLNHTLHVPQFTKKLLSISDLTCDNNAIIEFNSQVVFVKDKNTKRVLLKGMLKDDLYRVLLPKVDLALSVNFNNPSLLSIFNKYSDPFTWFKSSLSAIRLWHFQLGHPAPLIMNKVAKLSNNSFFSSNFS